MVVNVGLEDVDEVGDTEKVARELDAALTVSLIVEVGRLQPDTTEKVQVLVTLHGVPVRPAVEVE